MELKKALACKWIRISLYSLCLSNLWNSQLHDIDANTWGRLGKKERLYAANNKRQFLS